MTYNPTCAKTGCHVAINLDDPHYRGHYTMPSGVKITTYLHPWCHAAVHDEQPTSENAHCDRHVFHENAPLAVVR